MTTATDNNSNKMKTSKKKSKHVHNKKPRMTKEERRAKYTMLARNRRDQKAQRQHEASLVCFNCRKKGHAASNCPLSKSNNKLCYKCGSTEHSLYKCELYQKDCTAQEQQDLPFATCFICQNKGHLSGKCPQNTHGIYVKGGGGCRNCGSKQHRASDCPENKKKKTKKEEDDGVHIEDLLEEEVTTTVDTTKKEETEKKKKKKRVVKF